MATVSMEQPSKNEAGTERKKKKVDEAREVCAKLLPLFAAVLVLADLAIAAIYVWDIISGDLTVGKGVQELVLIVVIFAMAFAIKRMGNDGALVEWATYVVAGLCVILSALLLLAVALFLIVSPVYLIGFTRLSPEIQRNLYLVSLVSVLMIASFGFILQSTTSKSSKPFAMVYLIILIFQAAFWAALFYMVMNAGIEMKLSWQFAQNLFLLIYTLILAGVSWLLPNRTGQENQS